MNLNVDLKVKIGDLDLKNPVMPASGTFASGRQFADFLDLNRLGAIVTKGVSLEPWPGNECPRIAETSGGMLNSIGLQNPGVEAFCIGDLWWLSKNAPDAPVIVNVVAHSAEGYPEVIKRLEREPSVAAYELNISCPNVDAGGMAFGVDCTSAAEVVSLCRAVTNRTLIVKLSPNVTDITRIARSVEAAGADGISLINTLLGMSVDAHTRRPRLARVVGGLSGPAIKPVALRMVWQVANAVAIPVIGMGGITSAEDAVEFLIAGATAVGIGTANFTDPRAMMQILDGLGEWCKTHSVSVTDLIGSLSLEA
ncbi:MAG: dihydroorotate dehydrogenase [Coriobacteriia bacterium]|nr:dihydroorotate dehydrogenase [Coriobacteriia bacterium]